MSEPKLNIKEETSAKKTRSPPKKAKVEQTVPKKKKLKTDADKAAEKAQHLRFGKAELTPDELSRLSKAQKREMYAAHAARSAVHREVEQYEDDNVGTQALSEGEKAARKAPEPQNLLRSGQTRLKVQKQPAVRATPTGSPGGGRNRIFRKATVPQPGRAAPLHRPQAAKRHPMAPLLQSPAWSRSSTKEDRWSAPQSTALPILQKATRTFF